MTLADTPRDHVLAYPEPPPTAVAVQFDPRWDGGDAAELWGALEGLFPYCLRLAGGRRADAEDLRMTVLLKAIEALARGDTFACDGAWLRRALRNQAIDQWRAAERHARLLGEPLHGLTRAAAPPSPEAALLSCEAARQIAAALGRLPAGQRLALELRCLEELPYAEVARRLCTTEPTARKRVELARRALAAGLEA